MKTFSIVIPTYNNKVLLKNTLEAFNHQTGIRPSEFEVVVADDGSTDDTYAYIQDAARSFELKYVYVERVPFSSRSRVRNEGWRAASGEHLVLLDSDMIVQPNYLSELRRCIEAGGSDLVILGNRFLLNKPVDYEAVAEGSVWDAWRELSKQLKYLEDRHFTYNKLSYNISMFSYPWLLVYSCNMSIPKKWMELVGGFDENFFGWGYEDTELGFRLETMGLKFLVNNKLEAYHQYHGETYGATMPIKKLAQFLMNYKYFYNKHRIALEKNISYSQLLFAYSSHSIPALLWQPAPEAQTVTLEYSGGADLEELKRQITELSKERGLEISLFDYREDSDLDLWVQLLGKTPSPVKYFPVSRMIDPQQAEQFLKEVMKINATTPALNIWKGFCAMYIYTPWFNMMKRLRR